MEEKYYRMRNMVAEFASGINGEEGEIGYCNVYTNDLSHPTNRAKQVLKFTEVEDATSYRIVPYSWNGTSWQEHTRFNPETYAKNNEHATFSVEDGVVTYTTGATNEGIYTYQAIAYSNQGIRIGQSQRVTSFEDACKFTVDRVQPIVEIIPSRDPDIGQWYSTRSSDTTVNYHNVPPTFTIDSDDTEAYLEYQWNDNGWEAYTGAIEYPGDGKYTLSIRGTDLAGNIGDDDLEVWFDFSNPEGIFLQIPDNNGYVRGTIELNFENVYDPSGSEEISRIEIWSSGYRGRAEQTGEGTYAFELDTTLLGDGQHNITGSIFDKAGNRTMIRQTIVVDNTTPTSTLSILADHHELKNRTLENSWKGLQWFKNFVEITIDIQGEQNDFVNYALVDLTDSCDTAAYSIYTGNLADEVNAMGDGQHKLCYYTEDLAGNTEVINHQILKRDASRGTATFTYVSGNEVGGIYFTQSPVEIRANLVDMESGIARTRLYVYDSDNVIQKSVRVDDILGAGITYSHTSIFNDLDDGNYYARVLGYDKAQNHTVSLTSRIYFTVDNEEPTTVFSEETSLLTNSYHSSPITISGISTDNNGVSHVNLYYQPSNPSGSWILIDTEEDLINLTGSDSFEWSFEWTPPSQGTFNIKASAVDLADNEENSPVIENITYDTTPPEPPVLTGDSVQYVNWGNVTRTWLPSSSTDVDYYMYENVTNGWTSGPYNADQNEYNITHLTGNYDRVFEWQILAVDYAGNETWSEDTYRVVVDGTKPTIKITNVDLIDKKLSFTVSGTDNLSGARTVATNIYNEDNSGPAVIGIGRLAHNITPETLNVSYDATDIDVSGLESGIYTIRAFIRDYSGNFQYATYKIEIDNTPPVLSQLDNFTLIQGTSIEPQIVDITEEVGLEKICLNDPVENAEVCDESIDPNIEVWDLMGFIADEMNMDTVDTTKLEIGVHTIEYYAIDLAGNISDIMSVTITVEENPPSVLIEGPTSAVVLGESVTLTASISEGTGTPEFEYLWTGDCSGETASITFTPDTTGEYSCTVTVTDTYNVVEETFEFQVVSEPEGEEGEEGGGAIDSVSEESGDVAGAQDQATTTTTTTTTLSTQTPGTGGPVYAYAPTTTDTEVEEETDDTEVEDTEDVEDEEETDVKGTEDENDVEEEQEGRPWWIYPLIILPLLLLFIILWKRRKEDEEPQY
jgi:hypothetical protein